MTTTISRPANLISPSNESSPGGPKDTQRATDSPTPILVAPAGADSRPANDVSPSKDEAPGGPELAGRHTSADAHSVFAASAQPADRHPDLDTQARGAVGFNVEQGRAAIESASTSRPSLLDPALALAADVLDDLERVRTANANRLRQLTRSVEDVDGEMRGFGLDESHPDVARLAAMVSALEKVEHDATLQLQRQMRRHPLYGWTKTAKGVGDKQVARLLAAIGDPYINSATGMPRTVSALWAYCGLHVLPLGQDRVDAQEIPAGGNGGDPSPGARDTQIHPAGVAPKRQRGQRANWSTNAKTRAYLIATSCLKQLVKPCHAAALDGRWLAVHYDECACSAYRVVYDRRRAHTAGTHPDWTDGHSHNDALRVASKATLRDLWREAKRIHETATT